MNSHPSLFDALHDENPADRGAIREALVRLKSEIKQAMDQGLTPEAMTVAFPVYTAVQAAENIVDKLPG